MIIRRELVPFRILLSTDKYSKAFIENMFEENYGDMDDKERVISDISELCLYQRDMGWGIHNIQKLINAFEKLDKEHPYDNGYTFNNVTESRIVWQDSHKIIIDLVHIIRDEDYELTQIVKRIEIKE